MNHQTLPDHIDKFRLGLYCADFSESYSFLRVAAPVERRIKSPLDQC